MEKLWHLWTREERALVLLLLPARKKPHVQLTASSVCEMQLAWEGEMRLSLCTSSGMDGYSVSKEMWSLFFLGRPSNTWWQWWWGQDLANAQVDSPISDPNKLCRSGGGRSTVSRGGGGILLFFFLLELLLLVVEWKVDCGRMLRNVTVLWGELLRCGSCRVLHEFSHHDHHHLL